MAPNIDKRILNLSYSSRNTLKKCARRFQLYRLNSKEEKQDDGGIQSLTFAYGHAVGLGVQGVFEGKSFGQIAWEMFLQWDVELLAVDTKRNKSFFGALHAVRQMVSARENGFLDDYELVFYEGKPACELSFLIRLPDGFVYRGYVDLVLQHKQTGKVVVIECKTITATTVNPAQYKNSAQAIGYSIVLDALFPNLSSYEVYYLVYPTKKEEWVTIPFEKSYFQRALWIRELLLDCEMIKLYEEAQVYPMNGEACFDFFRECEYLQHCTMTTKNIVEDYTEAMGAKIDEDLAKFQIQIGIQDLIDAQIKKNSAAPEYSHVESISHEDELL